MRYSKGWLFLGAYVGCIVAANWAVSTFGLVPVLGISGLLAPAGVYFAGLTFACRNQVQEDLGRRWSVLAIPVGALLSALTGSTHFALASGLTFLLSETCDYLVYTPIRKRGRPLAMAASCVVADVVDSVVFLLLAFGSLDALAGQLVGKWLVVVPIVIFLGVRSRAVSRVHINA